MILVEYCGNCNRELGDGNVLSFDGKQYHERCFACVQCKKPFGHEQVFIKDNRNFCGSCIAGTCNTCKKAIGSAPAFEVGGKKYHERCFSCFRCKIPLPDGSCCLIDNNPHCLNCSNMANRAGQPRQNSGALGNCGACQKALTPSNHVGMSELSCSYHKECFTCSNCFSPLSNPGTQVFVNNDFPYCKPCMTLLSRAS